MFNKGWELICVDGDASVLVLDLDLELLAVCAHDRGREDFSTRFETSY